MITNLSFIGWKQSLGCKTDDMYDVSLICEEDLLTTIFCACDIEHTGVSVAVALLQSSLKKKKKPSKLVCYILRHGNLWYVQTAQLPQLGDCMHGRCKTNPCASFACYLSCLPIHKLIFAVFQCRRSRGATYFYQPNELEMTANFFQFVSYQKKKFKTLQTERLFFQVLLEI